MATNINMTKPVVTLATEGTYCENDIKVSAKLQNKSVTPTTAAQTVEADEGYAGLRAVDVAAATRTAITAMDLSYGDQNVTYNSTEGIGLNGVGKVTYADGTVDDITKDLEVPLIAKEGLKADASADNKKVEIKIDPAHSVYMATVPPANSAVPVKTGNAWSGIVATPSASASSVVTRDANGRSQFATPVLDGDAANKAYVDAKGPAGTVVELTTATNATQGTLTTEQLAILQASDNASIMLDHKKYYLEGKGHQEGYLTYTHVGYENNVHILESITITISTRAWVLNASDVYGMKKMTQAAYNALETKDSGTLYLIVG